MSEKKKKEPKYYYEKTWKLDCWLALHQKQIWLLCAALAIALGVLVMQLLPPVSARTGVIILAILLMLGYQWAARAPHRALNGWTIKCNQKEKTPEDFLSFLNALEKKLPAMKKKEMAFRLTQVRAFLLFLTGKQQEGIDLLENFDGCWDEKMKRQIAEDIRQLKEKMGQTPDNEEDHP